MGRRKLSKLGQKYLKPTKVGKAGTRKATQVGAICTRKKNEKREVLLITSRGTRRWVIPKGWQMDGLSDSQAATVEAWEEAGVSAARVTKRPLGTYDYKKELNKGDAISVSVNVFRLKVEEMKKKFPEYRQRKLCWVSPKKAAKLVREPGLRKLFLALHK